VQKFCGGCSEANIKDDACVNKNCSHSSFEGRHPLHSLISKVVITANCSSRMLQKIEEFQLRPAMFRINNTWQSVKI
jgi:hypothetical protein